MDANQAFRFEKDDQRNKLNQETEPTAPSLLNKYNQINLLRSA